MDENSGGDLTKDIEPTEASEAGEPTADQAVPTTRRRFHGPHRIAYPVVFVLVCFASVWLIQMGTYANVRQGLAQASRFVFGAWFGQTAQGSWGLMVVASLVIVALIYAVLIALTNYFWISTGVVLGLAMVFSTVNHMKLLTRNEPLQPADLAWADPETASLIPLNGRVFMWVFVGLLVLVIAAVIALTIVDRPRRLFGWRRWQGWAIRGATLVVSGSLLLYTVGSIGNTDSVSGKILTNLGETPALWDPTYDYQVNGALTAFTRYISPTVMDEPAGYSQAAMDEIEQRYASAADQINQTRTGNLSDQSVVFILCESCKPPSMTPNLTVTPDPTPFLNSLSGITTTGTMLSTGYGGGTANIEYQALTGMSMGLLSPNLTVPYQQLVPTASYTPSVANWWPTAQAIHPFYPTMYSRQLDYYKFGMDPFWTLQEPNVVTCQTRIAGNPYISDQCAYQEVIDKLNMHPDETQFINLVTMQDHGPYDFSYADNNYKVSGYAAGDASNIKQVQTFAKGMNYTDQATEAFLQELDQLNRPVTVVWYGDHSAGLFGNDLDSPADRLASYETQYFIYSNAAARGHGTILDNSAYSSSNFFIAQTAEQTSSKVSPFIALLTLLHEQFAAMGVSVANATATTVEANQRSSGDLLLLDSKGQPIDPGSLTAAQQQLLDDYRLVQYDIVAGNHYVKDNGFMDLPAGG